MSENLVINGIFANPQPGFPVGVPWMVTGNVSKPEADRPPDSARMVVLPTKPTLTQTDIPTITGETYQLVFFIAAESNEASPGTILRSFVMVNGEHIDVFVDEITEIPTQIFLFTRIELTFTATRENTILTFDSSVVFDPITIYISNVQIIGRARVKNGAFTNGLTEWENNNAEATDQRVLSPPLSALLLQTPRNIFSQGRISQKVHIEPGIRHILTLAALTNSLARQVLLVVSVVGFISRAEYIVPRSVFTLPRRREGQEPQWLLIQAEFIPLEEFVEIFFFNINELDPAVNIFIDNVSIAKLL